MQPVTPGKLGWMGTGAAYWYGRLVVNSVGTGTSGNTLSYCIGLLNKTPDTYR